MAFKMTGYNAGEGTGSAKTMAKQKNQAELDLANGSTAEQEKLALSIYNDYDASDYKGDGKSFESVKKEIINGFYKGGKTGHIGEDTKRKYDNRDWTKFGGPKKNADGTPKTIAKQGKVTKDNPDTDFNESLTPDKKGEDYVNKKRANQSKTSGDAYAAFVAKMEAFKKSGKTLTKEQIAKLKSVSDKKLNNANTDINAQNFTTDSIKGVHKKYNEAVVIDNKKAKDKQTGDDEFSDLLND